MKTASIVGIVLVVLGVVALVYGRITYTREEKVLDIGPIEATAERTWAAVERAWAEENLRDRENRLQLALEASGMGTFVWNIDGDRLEPDSRLLALFGLPSNGTLSSAPSMVARIHADDRARYTDAVARAIDPAGSGALREEVRVQLPDGTLPLPGELSRVGSAEHRALAREAVRSSLVLLDNHAALLPLKKSLRRIHVAGSHADDIGNQSGGRVFLFLATDDFERDFAAFTAAGLEWARPPADHDYGRVAVFRDLYGNLWDLVQFSR